MTMPDYRDPKFVNPDEWNTTGDYPLTADHILDICELDSVRACLRSLVEFIEARGLSAEIEVDIEWARELLARK